MRRTQILLASALLFPLLCDASNDRLQRVAELENMLIQDCGSCHGLQFKGGLGPPLLPRDLQHKPREMLIATILYGRPGTAMPPWNLLLNRSEAEWMIDYLLGNKTP